MIFIPAPESGYNKTIMPIPCFVATLFLLCAHGPSLAEPVKDDPFPQQVATTYTHLHGLPSSDVRTIRIGSDGVVFVETAGGSAYFKDGSWISATESIADPRISRDEDDIREMLGLARDIPINQISRSVDGRIAVATEDGLFLVDASGVAVRAIIRDSTGRQWASQKVRGVDFDGKGRLWVATPAGAIHGTDESWTFYTGAEGLPYNDFTWVETGVDGSVWFGTTKGAIRFDGTRWQYRQGRRWLPDDRVRQIAADESGGVWIATAGGVAHIADKPMTLAAKAAYYEREIAQYIKRTPYGYVSKSYLASPGDKTAINHQPGNNDGLWTGMYGAAQAFAYAATKNPATRTRANEAFDALSFLQSVTQGGTHPAPAGYVARTILSTKATDPNIGLLEQDRRRQEMDAQWKVVEPRWPKSADGQWYWKSDTSSDELDGHYFFYALFYDLVANSETERRAVREVVASLTDHLIEHDWNLVDHTGTHTRWGVFAPDELNGNAEWIAERGLNSLSLLTYLTVAHHVTGDDKYQKHLQQLIAKHHYDINAMVPKIQFGVGSGNQSDDELAFMCFFTLLRLSQNEELVNSLRYAFHLYWRLEQPEMNPFFNFAYAAVAGDAEYRDQWGVHSLRPWSGWLADSLLTLKDFPLDRVNWAHENSHRIDIVDLQELQRVDFTAPHVKRRGARVDGKVLPVSERFFDHWNADPWQLDSGGAGNELASGTAFLLPYYMGLYLGIIEAPSESEL